MNRIICSNFLVVLCFLSCTSPEPTESYTISGRLADIGVSASHRAVSVSDYQIWKVPVYSDPDNAVSPHILNDKEVFVVGEDGSFSIPLETDHDVVFLLMDFSSDDPKQQLTGYLTVEDLLAFPLKEMTADLDLGEVTVSEEGDGESDKSLETVSEAFSFPVEELRMLARSDDILRNIKNHYINLENGHTAAVWYDFHGSLNTLYSDGFTLEDINSSQLSLNFYAPEYDPDPENISVVSPSGQILQTGTCYPNLSAVKYYSTIPAPAEVGYWSLSGADGTVYAEFDIAAVDPLDENGYLLMPIAEIQLITNAGGDTLTGLRINWVYLDDQGQKIAIVDESSINTLIDRETMYIQAAKDGNVSFCYMFRPEELNGSLYDIEFLTPVSLDMDSFQMGYRSQFSKIIISFW